MRVWWWRAPASLLVAVVCAGALAPTGGANQAVPSAEAAFAHVQHLAGGIGPRPAGTPAERAAADYIAGQLRQYGYAVDLHAFQFPFFEARRVEVQQVGASQRPIAAQALFYSTSTPAAGIEADVVAAGLGRPADYEGLQAAGAIVLLERGTITFQEKAANAAARGALAVVIYNNQPGVLAGTLLQRSEIPAVTISQEDGRQLAEAAQRSGLRLRLLVDTVLETRSSSNVVATVRGTARPGEILVVGAHYDSVPVSPGANDNASGVAATLEAARVLAGTPPPSTVQFVLFSAEELGLFGSAAFAGERRQGVIAMVNLDMVGWGERLMIGASPGRDDSALGAAEQVAQRLGIPVTRFRAPGSDHVSFERYGIPAVFLHRGVDPYYHQPTDVPANITPGHLEEAARLVVGLVSEMGQRRSGRLQRLDVAGTAPGMTRAAARVPLAAVRVPSAAVSLR